MHTEFYGLHEHPFQMTPNARLYFPSAAHRRAHAHLTYGLAQHEGFIVVTGEVGAGKTTLIERLCEELDPHGFVIARISTTLISGDDMLRLVADAFGAEPEGNKAAVLRGIAAALRHSPRRHLLIVDEAQGLVPSALEELRMLSNLTHPGQPPLQTLLMGQPQLRRLLVSPALSQLRQRVLASYHLGGLSREETHAYVMHRLRAVGWAGRPSWEPGALDLVHQHSDGLPRRINRLCARVLLSGALEERDHLTAAMVAMVAQELEQDLGGGAMQRTPQPRGAARAEPVPQEVRQPEARLAEAGTAEVAPAPPLTPGTPGDDARLAMDAAPFPEEGPVASATDDVPPAPPAPDAAPETLAQVVERSATPCGDRAVNDVPPRAAEAMTTPCETTAPEEAPSAEAAPGSAPATSAGVPPPRDPAPDPCAAAPPAEPMALTPPADALRWLEPAPGVAEPLGDQARPIEEAPALEPEHPQASPAVAAGDPPAEAPPAEEPPAPAPPRQGPPAPEPDPDPPLRDPPPGRPPLQAREAVAVTEMRLPPALVPISFAAMAAAPRSLLPGAVIPPPPAPATPPAPLVMLTSEAEVMFDTLTRPPPAPPIVPSRRREEEPERLFNWVFKLLPNNRSRR